MSEGDKPAAGGVPAIDYAALMRNALLAVVRQVLARAADEGLPGEHHFLLGFGAGEDGVVMPERLRRQFPDEMTIVLQHQFWNLAVDDGGFSVTLRFGGTPERLVVPWPALRTFADPSVGFGLRLRPEQEAPPPVERAAGSATQRAEPSPQSPDKIVDFSSFRRRGGDEAD